MDVTGLAAQHCTACRTGDPPLAQDRISELRGLLHADWALNDSGDVITRRFKFANYYQTMAFVNALAWIAHREDHHPDLEVGYNRCVVHFSTHAVGGLSENDFICAAKTDLLLRADA